jgi:hypothetical protein
MNSYDYAEVLDQLRGRYLEVLHRRDALNEELKGIAKSIEGLSTLTGEGSIAPDPTLPSQLASDIFRSWIKYMGFSDACRAVLRIAPSGLTPTEIRDTLAMVGFPLEKRSNAIVSVHVFLDRAIKAEEVGEILRDDGEKAYQWRWKHELTPTPDEIEKYRAYERLIKLRKAFGQWDVNDPENPIYVSGMRPNPPTSWPLGPLPEKKRELTHDFRPGTYVDLNKKG